MNLRPSGSDRHPRGVRLVMTPMIDVVFLLLVFFLVSTTYRPQESELASSLRAERASSIARADFDPQVLEVTLIDGRPGFRFGSRTFTDQARLTEALRELPKEPGIFVKGDPAVRTGAATAALQACRDAGFTKVTYVPKR